MFHDTGLWNIYQDDITHLRFFGICLLRYCKLEDILLLKIFAK